jgi:uncharacterized protein YndB with AHSA1/START domain
MRLQQTFSIARPPEEVFDYVVDHRNLARWQTTKVAVEPLTEGPPRLGTRVKERTKPRVGKPFDQVVEFTTFDRPSELCVHVVEGPLPVDGTWRFEPDGAGGTRVHFSAEGPVTGPMRLLEPILQRVMTREFAGYHAHLKRNVEAGAPGQSSSS